MKKLRIVVGGFIGIMPAGGITWDYIQYPLGFKALGHDVYYIEDTRLYPIYQKTGSDWNDASSSVEHLKNVMEYFGFKDCWAYRDEASGKCFGLSEAKIKLICSKADVFVNISCSTFLRDEYLRIPARILIDSDPMFTQIQYLSQQMFTPGAPGLQQMVDAHNYHFTFGENICKSDCSIPLCGINWLPTRQPVCLSYWKYSPVSKVPHSFTTLMNWAAAKPLEYDGRTWGQKDIEFQKFLSIPQQVNQASFSIIVNQTGGTEQNFGVNDITRMGWQVLNPDEHAGDWRMYQTFIASSSGEFSVAKQTYVDAVTGWFSCRSTCYLAAGKPVVTQDTGWSANIPSGKGLFGFTNMETAVCALENILSDYKKQSLMARQIAENYFDSDKILSNMLSKIS